MSLTPRVRPRCDRPSGNRFCPLLSSCCTGRLDKICAHYGLCDHHEAMAFIGQHIVKIGSDFNYNPWAADVSKVELTPSGGPVHTDADHEELLHTDELAACGIAATACRTRSPIR